MLVELEFDVKEVTLIDLKNSIVVIALTIVVLIACKRHNLVPLYGSGDNSFHTVSDSAHDDGSGFLGNTLGSI